MLRFAVVTPSGALVREWRTRGADLHASSIAQRALKGIRVPHPDSKRTYRAKMEAKQHKERAMLRECMQVQQFRGSVCPNVTGILTVKTHPPG